MKPTPGMRTGLKTSITDMPRPRGAMAKNTVPIKKPIREDFRIKFLMEDKNSLLNQSSR